MDNQDFIKTKIKQEPQFIIGCLNSSMLKFYMQIIIMNIRRNLIKIFKSNALIFLFFVFAGAAKAADGTLSGYAWSENAGWINFAPSGGGVTVDTAGNLKGYAWGENLGWISFNCVDANSCAASSYRVDISPYPCTIIGGGGGGSCPACPSLKQDTKPPVISKASIISAAPKAVAVSWETDKKADSMVEYGLDASYDLISGNPADVTLPVSSHKVNILNLSADTLYRFRIISRDENGNIAKSGDLTFKTPLPAEKEKAEEADKLKLAEKIIYELVSQGAASDGELKKMIERVSVKPVILTDEAAVKDITSYSARIAWQTDKETSGLVRLKPADNSKSEWREVGFASNYSLKHEIALGGLSPKTRYEYQVKSIDVLGNAVSSKLKIFTTKSVAAISEVKASDIALDAAVISWTTTVLTTSEMDYGRNAGYDSYASAKSKDRVTAHEIKLSKLISGATYHFRVKGTDEEGNPVISDDYVFTTNALPAILNYAIENINDNSAVIKWVSNIDVDSVISYMNEKTLETRTQGDTKLTKSHLLKVANLDPGTNYIFKIESSDAFGNKTKSPEFKAATLLDELAPGIASVRTFTTITQNKNSGQAVIAWKTNEPATSQVFFYSIADKSNPAYTSAFDSNLTTNHTVVFTDLAPGTAYRFNIQSKDKSGNAAVSDDFSILMPSADKSIIQMITGVFEKMFGWVRKIKL